MADIIPASVFYATNKDVFDLIMSSKREFSAQLLREFLARRGILLSRTERFEDIARYLSSLELSSADRLELEDQLTDSRRAEKMTVSTVQTTMDAERLATVAAKLAEKRTGLQEQFQADFSSGALELEIAYTDIDYGKTTLKQKRERDMRMEFVQAGDTLTIRRPANGKSDEILSGILDILAEQETAKPKVREVDLSGLATAELRNRFFTRLICALDGLAFVDVAGVWVARVAEGTDAEGGGALAEDEGEKDNGALVDGGGEENVGAEVDETGQPLAKETVGQLSRALLEGTGVLGTRGYKSFISEGFSISWIRWTCKTTDRDEDLVKFEAGLQSPGSGEGFRYNICGLYRKKEDGSYTQRLSAKPSEKRRFFPILEEATWGVLDEINSHLRADALSLETTEDLTSKEATP
jgi:hypothetical protein